jgi:hypothetical protein
MATKMKKWHTGTIKRRSKYKNRTAGKRAGAKRGTKHKYTKRGGVPNWIKQCWPWCNNDNENEEIPSPPPPPQPERLRRPGRRQPPPSTPFQGQQGPPPPPTPFQGRPGRGQQGIRPSPPSQVLSHRPRRPKPIQQPLQKAWHDYEKAIERLNKLETNHSLLLNINKDFLELKDKKILFEQGQNQTDINAFIHELKEKKTKILEILVLRLEPRDMLNFIRENNYECDLAINIIDKIDKNLSLDTTEVESVRHCYQLAQLVKNAARVSDILVTPYK